eukprot:g13145.t1
MLKRACETDLCGQFDDGFACAAHSLTEGCAWVGGKCKSDHCALRASLGACQVGPVAGEQLVVAGDINATTVAGVNASSAGPGMETGACPCVWKAERACVSDACALLPPDECAREVACEMQELPPGAGSGSRVNFANMRMLMLKSEDRTEQGSTFPAEEHDQEAPVVAKCHTRPQFCSEQTSATNCTGYRLPAAPDLALCEWGRETERGDFVCRSVPFAFPPFSRKRVVSDDADVQTSDPDFFHACQELVAGVILSLDGDASQVGARLQLVCSAAELPRERNLCGAIRESFLKQLMNQRGGQLVRASAGT